MAGSASSISAGVAATGQTTCYAVDGSVIADCSGVGVGQDGDLQKGVTWPSPRFTASNGTVTDNLTGLIWLKNTNCAAATRVWATAITDVTSLNSAGTMNSINCTDTSNGGSFQTDWRLPNVKELQSLIDFAYSSPALSDAAGTAQWTTNGDAFDNVQSSNYWSSTTYSAGTTIAWYVLLSSGYVGSAGKANARYVWPVRGP